MRNCSSISPSIQKRRAILPSEGAHRDDAEIAPVVRLAFFPLRIPLRIIVLGTTETHSTVVGVTAASGIKTSGAGPVIPQKRSLLVGLFIPATENSTYKGDNKEESENKQAEHLNIVEHRD